MGTRIESTAVVTGDLVHRSGRKLADHSIREALTRAAIEPSQVDLLLNAGLFHDRVLGEPAMAALIQQDVELNPGAKDLLKVSGIGQKLFDGLKDRVVV